jgi:hypothetical protein
MATVSIDGDELSIDIQRLDKVWTLTSRISVPLAHVRGATADPGMVREPKGVRRPGTHIPGVLVAGSFEQDGERVFWDVHDMAKAVVIELAEGEKYRRLVIQVEDPRSTADFIEQAVSRARRLPQP